MKTNNYTAALAVAAVLSVTGAVTAPVWAGGHDKVGVCHRTASESNPYVYISVPADEANGHITGTDKQHNLKVTWPTDGTWRGVPHKAGDLRLDYYASSPASCEDTTPPPTTTTSPPTTTPTTTTSTPTTTTSTPTTTTSTPTTTTSTPTTTTSTPTTTTSTPTTTTSTPTTTTSTPTTTTSAPITTTSTPSVTVSPSTGGTNIPGGGGGGGNGGGIGGGGGGGVEVKGQQASAGAGAVVAGQPAVPTAVNAGLGATTTQDDDVLLPVGLATLGALLGLLAFALRRRQA